MRLDILAEYNVEVRIVYQRCDDDHCHSNRCCALVSTTYLASVTHPISGHRHGTPRHRYLIEIYRI